VPFTEEPGEAAFYGPKIDFVIKDVIGREWQLGTVQVDYVLPVRFDLTYIGADNEAHRPVMIHRAPFGSMERFCGVLIEHFAGDFPLWLAPEQVRLLPISDKVDDYAKTIFDQFLDLRHAQGRRPARHVLVLEKRGPQRLGPRRQNRRQDPRQVQFPDNPEFAVFLALTLHQQGKAADALRLALDTLCETTDDPGLTAYQRAIRHAAAKL
jgi:hypothetical protein